jgi:hypothetical protein
MQRVVRSSVALAVLFLALGTLVSCGGKDGEKDREGMPFRVMRLKNLSPKGGKPASAQVVGKKNGQPTQTHHVDNVPPGGTGDAQPEGTEAANEVSVTVTFEGEPPLTGSRMFPSDISTVSVEAQPGSGTATVEFTTPGQPAQIIPLNP